jgi:hypothetical protein
MFTQRNNPYCVYPSNNVTAKVLLFFDIAKSFVLNMRKIAKCLILKTVYLKKWAFRDVASYQSSVLNNKYIALV